MDTVVSELDKLVHDEDFKMEDAEDDDDGSQEKKNNAGSERRSPMGAKRHPDFQPGMRRYHSSIGLRTEVKV